MRLPRLAALGIAAVGLTLLAPAARANFIANGGFEQFTGTPPQTTPSGSKVTFPTVDPTG